MTETLTRDAEPQPLYQRIKDHILDRIVAGTWPAGHKIPSENQLVDDLGISRMTINRAIRELTSEGYLSRLIGVGTFVRDMPRQTSMIEIMNIADEITARGHAHVCDVISLREVAAQAGLAERFEGEAGMALYHIVALHREDGVPVQLEERFVAPALAPDFLAQDFTAQTPTAYLLSLAAVEQLEHVVKAIMPTRTQHQLLEITADEPCLVVQRRSWSYGAVASTATLTYPASRYELKARFATNPNGRLGGQATV